MTDPSSPTSALKWIESHPIASTLAAAVFIAFCSFLSVFTGVPTKYSPFSMFSLVFALFISEWGKHQFGFYPPGSYVWRFLCTLPMPILFVIWSYPLFKAQNRIPLRSLIAFAIFALGSVAYFLAIWSDGIKYYGPTYTAIALSYNIVPLLLLVELARRNRGEPVFWSNFSFHTVLFSWLAFSAFPYLTILAL